MMISCNDEKAIEMAIVSLRSDNTFVYPTDTLYGFGADASSENALERLYEIKQRPESMPLSILVSGLDMLKRYAVIPSAAEKLIKHFLPGALTLVLPAKDRSLPKRLFSMEGYLGFRIPNHQFCLDLARKFNSPYVTTSVNISGKPALNSINAIKEEFSKEIELFISDDKLEKNDSNKGSTVVLIDKLSNVKVLREGMIPEKDLRAIL